MIISKENYATSKSLFQHRIFPIRKSHGTTIILHVGKELPFCSPQSLLGQLGCSHISFGSKVKLNFGPKRYRIQDWVQRWKFPLAGPIFPSISGNHLGSVTKPKKVCFFDLLLAAVPELPNETKQKHISALVCMSKRRYATDNYLHQ